MLPAVRALGTRFFVFDQVRWLAFGLYRVNLLVTFITTISVPKCGLLSPRGTHASKMWEPVCPSGTTPIESSLDAPCTACACVGVDHFRSSINYVSPEKRSHYSWLMKIRSCVGCDDKPSFLERVYDFLCRRISSLLLFHHTTTRNVDSRRGPFKFSRSDKLCITSQINRNSDHLQMESYPQNML